MNALEKKIIKANKAYREGNPIMTDQEYDQLIDKLKKENPESEIFKKGVLESGGEEELPLPMFSLEKVKSEIDVKKWLSKFLPDDKICIMPKYDGISILVDTQEKKAWTRGDGVKGFQRSDRFFKLKYSDINIGSRYVWGEAIMSKENFDNYLDKYKTARNMVAGLFNSDSFDDTVKDVDFCPYGSDKECDKEVILKEFFKLDASLFYRVVSVKNLMKDPETYFTELFNIWSSCYNIDGIVLEVNSYNKKIEMGRMPNGNPYYSIAVKLPQWQEKKEAYVKDIEWGVGKDGVLTPVININPVELGGVTVARISGHNTKYIEDNCIGRGALITVKRSGDVIPKHEKTIEIADVRLPEKCPYCNSILEKGEVDLICPNEECKERRISQLVFFFKTIGIEEMGEPTIVKLYDNGYKTAREILEAPFSAFPGKAKFVSLHEQWDKIGKLPLAKVMTAMNVFGGVLGEKTCQSIFNELREEKVGEILTYPVGDQGREQELLESLVTIKGVGDRYAKAFIQGLMKFDFNSLPQFEWQVVEEKGEGERVCFSGFRDKEAETKLQEIGYVIVDSVTKETNILIVKDKTKSSSKIEKAKKLGIKIVELNEILVS